MVGFQSTAQVWLSLFAAAITLGAAWLLWRHRDAPGAKPMLAFLAGIVLWTAGNAGQHAMTTLDGKLLWSYPQYLGLAMVPPAWYAFAMEFTGRDRWVTRRKLALVATPFALTVLLAWTNQWHHLVRDDARVVLQGGVWYLERDFGVVAGFMYLFSNALNLVASLVLAHGIFGTQRFARVQAMTVFIGLLVPWFAGVFYWTGVWRVEPEVFFAVSGLAFVYAIQRQQLFDLVPVARNRIIEEMRDGVLVLDAEERVVDANPEARYLLADAGTLAAGSNLSELEGPAGPFVRAVRSGGTDGPVVLTDADGKPRDVDVHVTELGDDVRRGGQVVELRDVTDLRERERALAVQNERLEDVADTIAHDLRNPIQVADGHLDLLREGDEERRRRAVEKIDDSLERMESIIDDVLTLAQQGDVDASESIDVERVAEAAWAGVETADASLDVDAEGSVLGDEGQIRTMLENLFRNAVEHGGPDVRVRLTGVPAPEATGDGKTYAGIAVEDDGPGIPESRRESVLDHGYTTNDSGTGFGLSIVARVADAHGWTVDVGESERGGARVTIGPADRVGQTDRAD